MKFKKGDIVIGNKKNRYFVTKSGIKVKVEEVRDVEYMDVLYCGESYTVRQDWFDLVKKKGISFK